MISEDNSDDENISERGDSLRNAKRKNCRDDNIKKKLKLQDSKWSLDEKCSLLEAIKRYGPENYKRIARSVKSRSTNAVKRKIEELSSGVRQSASQEIISDSNPGNASIEQWMDLFQEIVGSEEDFSAQLGQTLGLIVRNEKFGESGVPRLHWQNIYQFLMDLAEDRPTTKSLTEVESLVVLDLMNSLRETLQQSDTAQQKRMLEVKFALLTLKSRQTNNYALEKDIVSQLIAQAFTNDFRVVEKILKEDTASEDQQVQLSLRRPKYLALNPAGVPSHLLQFQNQSS